MGNSLFASGDKCPGCGKELGVWSDFAHFRLTWDGQWVLCDEVPDQTQRAIDVINNVNAKRDYL